MTGGAPAAGPCWRLIGDREGSVGTGGGASHVSSIENPALISRKHLERTITTHRILSLGATSFAPGASSMIAHHICTATVIVMRLVSIIERLIPLICVFQCIDCFQSRLPLRNSRVPCKGEVDPEWLTGCPSSGSAGNCDGPILWCGATTMAFSVAISRGDADCIEARWPHYTWCLHWLGIVTVAK